MSDAGEVRVTDPDTGGQKGHKDCEITVCPAEVMLELGKCYANGTKKYSRNNFRKGHAWSLSADALQRHFWQWVAGEKNDNDPELIQPTHHLAAVMYHAAVLMYFDMNNKGTDDVRDVVARMGLTFADIQKEERDI